MQVLYVGERIALTKYYSDSHKYEPRDDLPISVTNYENIDNRADRWCPYCRCRLMRILDYSGRNPNWYCSRCSINYDNPSDTKSQSYLGIPAKSNDSSPAVSYPPEPSIGKQPVEPKGGFAALKARGLKIINYKEGVG
jgi:hypothetical protein